jgi:hypothetical protein
MNQIYVGNGCAPFKKAALLCAIFSCSLASSYAQDYLPSPILEQQFHSVERAGAEINPHGALNANPTNPGGAVFIGNNMWATDAVMGFVRYDLLGTVSTDPFLADALAPNPLVNAPGVTSAGQVVVDPNGTNASFATVYAADYGGGKAGGVKRIVIDVVNEVVVSVTKIASTAGLEGNQTTALALGPDGSLYVGFLRSPDIKRILNPLVGTTQVVESVGTAPEGKKLRALAFLGTSLYMATEIGIGVINQATNAVGHIPNSILIPVATTGSAHLAIASDGVSNLFFSVMGSVGVIYDIPVTPGITPNFAFPKLALAEGPGFGTRTWNFPKGHTSMLAFDPNGNLWIGEDLSPEAAISSGVGRVFMAPNHILPGTGFH